MNKKKLYITMLNFLEKYYNQTRSDDLAILLGSAVFNGNETSMDPAMWSDWKEIVDENIQVNDGYFLMIKYLEHYNTLSYSSDIENLLKKLKSAQINEQGEICQMWNASI